MTGTFHQSTNLWYQQFSQNNIKSCLLQTEGDEIFPNAASQNENVIFEIMSKFFKDNRESFVAIIRQFLFKMPDKMVLRMNVEGEILNVTKNGEFDPTWNLHVDKLVQIANEVRKKPLNVITLGPITSDYINRRW